MYLADEPIKTPPRGCYYQRDGESLVLKAHLRLGMISLPQLEAILEVLDSFPKAKMRLTTRQNARFYDLPEAEVEAVRDRLEAKGFLFDRRSTGLCLNADHGLCDEEPFDISPYAEALADWMDDVNGKANRLPGKLKVSLSSTTDGPDNISYADIAFVAARKEDKPVFHVLGGGSLGAQPRLAFSLLEALPAERLLAAMDAISDVFYDLFADMNIGKKRMRFRIRQIGEDGFREMFQSYLAKAEAPPLLISPSKSHKERIWASEPLNADLRFKSTCFKGIYSVGIPSKNGFVNHKMLSFLVQWLGALNHPVEMTLASNQSILLRDLGGKEAEQLLHDLSEAGLDLPLLSTVSCAGASYCRFGLTHTEALSTYFDELEEEDLPPIQVSGCMNSCSAQQVAGIGFWGKKLNADDLSQEVFDVMIGGARRHGDEPAVLAESIGSMNVLAIRDFMPALIEAKEEAGCSWTEYLTDYQEDIRQLAEPHIIKRK